MTRLKEVQKKSPTLGSGFIKIIIFLVLASIFLFHASAAPVPPSTLNYVQNTTKGADSAQQINITGGYIGELNLSATVQNTRWKGFVGQVNGLYTLDDAAGSTLYDWTLSSISGRIYATRATSAPTWGSINCSNVTFMEAENENMNHTNADDNLTATFDDTTHTGFWIGAIFFPADYCPTLNTYIGNVTQDTDFEEMIMYDGTNTVYATIIENYVTGYDDVGYDFQMIVPEIGLPGNTEVTSYFVYVEII